MLSGQNYSAQWTNIFKQILFNFSGTSMFYYLWVVYRQKRFWPLWRNGVKPPHCTGTFMWTSFDSNSWISLKLQDKRPLAWSKFYLYDIHCFFTSISIHSFVNHKSWVCTIHATPYFVPDFDRDGTKENLNCKLIERKFEKKYWSFLHQLVVVMIGLIPEK